MEGSRKIEQLHQHSDSANIDNLKRSDNYLNIPKPPVAVQNNLPKAGKFMARKVGGARQKLTKVIPKLVEKENVIENSLPASFSRYEEEIEKEADQMPPAPLPTFNNISLVHSDKDGKNIRDESLILQEDSIVSNSAPLVTDRRFLIDEAIEKALQDRLDRVLHKKDLKKESTEVKMQEVASKITLGPEFVKLSTQVDHIERNVKHLVDVVEVNGHI